MIERISELPFFGPEEQLRKFICQHDEGLDPQQANAQNKLTQARITNIDDILQRQLIWSRENPGADDAYFYWDWCPNLDQGATTQWELNMWDIDEWVDKQGLLDRDKDRSFNYRELSGYANRSSDYFDQIVCNGNGTDSQLVCNNGGQPDDIVCSIPVDQMVDTYDARTDVHARDDNSTAPTPSGTDIDDDDLLHNIMRSYIEVSEWLGDGATAYGSHNGYVSRKMSMCWLFDVIRALINFKLNNHDKYAEVTIHPLDVKEHTERFLAAGEQSENNVTYSDAADLDQMSGRCAVQPRQRSAKPDVNGILKVRGNEWHYGERADFYTHNSFMGECRFFHNTRFLGQSTFDKEINGTAMRSRWADLAEYRESDYGYEPGMLVMFGGEKEITISDGKHCNAIVTTKPGLVLNGDIQDGKIMVGIALTGTVPVQVVGKVKKFDRLVPSSEYPGFARARRWYDFFKRTIGIALGGKDATGKVDCITRLDF